MAQHRPAGSETTPPYTPRSSRFGSELPSAEDDVDIWRYVIVTAIVKANFLVIVKAEYNACILPIFLYGSDCWAISKTDTHKIDALDQWCLRMLLGIKWYQYVRNDDVLRLMKQPKLTAIIKWRRLTLFGHIMRMDH